MPRTAPGERPPLGDIETWASQCSELTSSGLGIQGVDPDPDGAARRTVLVDRRGDFTFCVDIEPGSGTGRRPLIGIAGLTDGAEVQQGWGSTIDSPVALPGRAEVLLVGGDGSPIRGDGGRPRAAYGLAGVDVTGVDLVLAVAPRWWPR